MTYIHIVGKVPGGSASARPYSATDAQRSSMAAPTDLNNVICAHKQQSVHTAQRLMPEAGAYSAAPHARGRPKYNLRVALPPFTRAS